MLINNNVFKYDTPNNGMFDVTQCWTNGTVKLECDTVKIGIIYITLIHIQLIQTLNISNVKRYV